MKRFLFSHSGLKRPFLRFLLCICLLCPAVLLCSCGKSPEPADYVSEHRSNVFVYSGQDFSVKAHAVAREYPYVADGYKGEMSTRAELFVYAPAGTESCVVYFVANGEKYGGDASYDSVKKQFYFSCSADLSSVTALPVSLTFNGEEREITAPSVRTDGLLHLKQVLNALFEVENELLSSLTEKSGLACELHVRLLYEDAPYYYVGVVDRKGNISSFLMDGKTGKILAKRKA